jgi:tetratricopeptide (TPR) repeat protein
MIAARMDVDLANAAVEALLMEANRRLQSRDLVQVETLCLKALATEPVASDAWHLIAIALAEQNRYPDAAAAVQRATELWPGNASYWLSRGIIAFDTNHLPEAQACFSNALEIDPKQSHARYFLGRSCHRAGRFADAISSYRKALRGMPDRAEISFHLARVLLAADRVPEALAAFQDAFAKDRDGTLDRRECFDCFRRLPVKPLPDFWRSELMRFFERSDIDKTRYVMGGLYVLMSRPAFRALLRDGDGHKDIRHGPDSVSQVFANKVFANKVVVNEVMAEPLFGILLRDAVIGHPQFERMLAALRHELLGNDALRAQAPLQFPCDLALQCVNNEFAYAESAVETAKIDELSQDIGRSVRDGGPSDDGRERHAQRHSRAAACAGRRRHPRHQAGGAERREEIGAGRPTPLGGLFHDERMPRPPVSCAGAPVHTSAGRADAAGRKAGSSRPGEVVASRCGECLPEGGAG